MLSAVTGSGLRPWQPAARAAAVPRARVLLGLALMAMLGLALMTGLVRALPLLPGDGPLGRWLLGLHLVAGLLLLPLAASWLPAHILPMLGAGVPRRIRRPAWLLLLSLAGTMLLGLWLTTPLLAYAAGLGWFLPGRWDLLREGHLVGGLVIGALLFDHLFARLRRRAALLRQAG